MQVARQIDLNVTEAQGAVFIGTASIAAVSVAAIGVVAAEISVLKTTAVLFVNNLKKAFAAFW